jgi:hypothetical protein
VTSDAKERPAVSMTTPAPLRTIGFLALVSLSSIPIPTVTAAPLTGTYSYSTWGDVGARAGVPVGTIDFFGTWQSTLLTPGSISLGQFESRALPEGAGLTYHNLPFYIKLNTEQVGGGYASSGGLSIEGVLNGTVTGTTRSDVMATVTSIQPFGPGPLPFPLASFHIDVPQVLAAPGVNGGRTTLTARIDPTALPVPEPTSWVVFAMSLAAGFYQYRRTR